MLGDRKARTDVTQKRDRVIPQRGQTEQSQRFERQNTGFMCFDWSTNYTGVEKVMPFSACFASASDFGTSGN